MSRSGFPALAGLLAVAAGAAVAELVAVLLGRPQAGTVVAVGAVLVDAAPTPVKEFAVATLGTADKPVLLGGIAVVLAVLAAGLGVVGCRSRAAGVAGAVVLGLVGVAAALTRPAAELVDALPSLVGAAVIAGRAAAAPAPPCAPLRPRVPVSGEPGPLVRPPSPRHGAAVDRRAFLGAAALVAAGAAAAGGGAALLGRSASGARVRESVRLPAAAEPAPPLPAGVGPGFVTANADFYRVDTALTVPRVDLASWRLTIGGLVDSPVELSFADLLDRPLVERVITLNCVSNEVGGPYIGTARWLGVPLAPLLREVGLRPGRGPAARPLGRRHDDRHPDGRAARRARAAALRRHERRAAAAGARLPGAHAHPRPLRLRRGLQVAARAGGHDLRRRRRLLGGARLVAAGHGEDRLADRPARAVHPARRRHRCRSPAWPGPRGAASGPSRCRSTTARGSRRRCCPCRRSTPGCSGATTGRRPPGSHTLAVRATDGTGAVQPEERATPFPDGATGWHTITVTVR